MDFFQFIGGRFNPWHHQQLAAGYLSPIVSAVKAF
jgi:hypothetical protein